MAVGVVGDGDRRVPKALHDGQGMRGRICVDEQRRARVTKIVKPHPLGETGDRKRWFEVASVEVVVTQRPTAGSGEQEIIGPPPPWG